MHRITSASISAEWPIAVATSKNERKSLRKARFKRSLRLTFDRGEEGVGPSLESKLDPISHFVALCMCPGSL